MPSMSFERRIVGASEEKLFSELSMSECDFSGLPQATCAHCTGDDLSAASLDEDEYVVVRLFTARENGRCCLVDEHKIKRGDVIGKLQLADNPLVPVPGWACKACAKSYPLVRED